MWTPQSQGPSFGFSQRIHTTRVHKCFRQRSDIETRWGSGSEKNEISFCWVSETHRNPRQRSERCWNFTLTDTLLVHVLKKVLSSPFEGGSMLFIIIIFIRIRFRWVVIIIFIFTKALLRCQLQGLLLLLGEGTAGEKDPGKDTGANLSFSPRILTCPAFLGPHQREGSTPQKALRPSAPADYTLVPTFHNHILVVCLRFRHTFYPIYIYLTCYLGDPETSA